jgi:hypothetical protein
LTFPVFFSPLASFFLFFSKGKDYHQAKLYDQKNKRTTHALCSLFLLYQKGKKKKCFVKKEKGI